MAHPNPGSFSPRSTYLRLRDQQTQGYHQTPSESVNLICAEEVVHSSSERRRTHALNLDHGARAQRRFILLLHTQTLCQRVHKTKRCSTNSPPYAICPKPPVPTLRVCTNTQPKLTTERKAHRARRRGILAAVPHSERESFLRPLPLLVSWLRISLPSL